MVRCSNATHVTGKPPHLKIQPWIDHPAFCACTRCADLDAEERRLPHSYRIKRASAFPDDFAKSVQYAGEVKRQEEQRLVAGGDGWMSARPEEITLAQIVKAYIDEHPKSRREEQILRQHILPFFENGRTPAAQIKAADWRRYQRHRVSQGASPDTVDREWNAARAVFNFAEEEERILRNPIRRGAVTRIGTGETRKEFFEPEEWRDFVAAFSDLSLFRAHLERERVAGPVRIVSGRSYGSGKRNPDSPASLLQFERLRELQPFIRALLWSCARLGELANLRWRDVDLRRRIVTLYQTKTRKAKALPIAAPWRAELESMQRGLPDAYVFTRSTGKPFGVLEVDRAFGLVLKVIGLKKNLVPHSIRHTVLSWLATVGVSQAHRDEIAGHARQAVGDGYAHLSMRALVPVIAVLVRIEMEGFGADELAKEMGQ